MSQHSLIPCSQPFSPRQGDWDPSMLPSGTAPMDILPLSVPGQLIKAQHWQQSRAAVQGTSLSPLWPCCRGWCRCNGSYCVCAWAFYMGASGEHFGSPLQSKSLSGSGLMFGMIHASCTHKHSKNYPIGPLALVTPKESPSSTNGLHKRPGASAGATQAPLL